VIWSDERGYILSFFTSIALFMFDNLNRSSHEQKSKINYKALLSMLSIPLAVLLRFYLTKNFDLGTNYMDPANDVGLDLFFKQIEQRFFLSALIQFEGFWILFLAASIFMYRRKMYFVFCLFTGAVIMNTLTSFIVGDIIRSASYGFPLIFISLIYLREINKQLMDILIALIFVVSFIIPPFQFLGDQISYYSPLPFHYIYFFRQFMPI
jgi:hypothetical protein